MRDLPETMNAACKQLDNHGATSLGLSSILRWFLAEGASATIVRYMSLVETRECGSSQWTVFCAASVTDSENQPQGVQAIVAQVTKNSANGLASIIVTHEGSNPSQIHCPPNVLSVLTPTTSTTAFSWRCRAAQWAAENYDYELDVEIHPSGRRSINVTVSNARSSAVVARTQGLESGIFSAMFEKLSSQHLMSSIRTTRT